MKDQYFCEVVQENDPVIKFRMMNANALDEVINLLKEQYTNIKEWVVKDMASGAFDMIAEIVDLSSS